MSETNPEVKFDRAVFEDVMKQRFFYTQAYDIYGGVAGLFDFGPPGCAVLTNVLTAWRNHFVLPEDMLEVSTTALTPEIVLKTSGHVDKFSDFMVRDVKTSECYRADKLIEETVDKLLETTTDGDARQELLEVRATAGAMHAKELTAAIAKYKVTSPAGNELSEPYPFNLMFQTQIGPTGKAPGYMRPETAQGIFVNFRRLLEYNHGKMPFAAAQIGPAFRNEIAPRSGLLRVREFTLAEIEHFVNPADKSHTKFHTVKDFVLTLLPREAQTGDDTCTKMTAGEAVAKGIINNETLAYFMVRTHLFLESLGIKTDRLRFRQHLSTEMAHYATDCWDAEIHNSYGWIECVGHADRAAYDLQVHTKASKVDLSAHEVFDKPRLMEVITVKPDAGKIGRQFRKDAKAISEKLHAFEKDKKAAQEFADELKKGPVKLQTAAGEFEIAPDMVDIKIEEKTVTGVRYLPNVIEPSYGVGRILYSMLEHAFWVRPGTRRSVLSLPPHIAPVKVAVFPVVGKPQALIDTAHDIARRCVPFGLSTKMDDSNASIGRRYARTDEIGVPFAITVDRDTLDKKVVTIRERDSRVQISVPVDEAVPEIAKIVQGLSTWAELSAKYPIVTRDAAEDEGEAAEAEKPAVAE